MRITNINILPESVNHNNNKKDQEDEKEKELTNKFLIEMKGDVENGIESVIKCKWLIIGICCVCDIVELGNKETHLTRNDKHKPKR